MAPLTAELDHEFGVTVVDDDADSPIYTPPTVAFADNVDRELTRSSRETFSEYYGRMRVLNRGTPLKAITPQVGWRSVEWLYCRVNNPNRASAFNFTFDKNCYNDYAMLTTAWDQRDDRVRGMKYDSYTHDSHSTWMQCTGERPFTGYFVPYVDFRFHFRGSGHPGRFLTASRSTDSTSQICYSGIDWKGRSAAMKPLRMFEYVGLSDQFPMMPMRTQIPLDIPLI